MIQGSRLSNTIRASKFRCALRISNNGKRGATSYLDNICITSRKTVLNLTGDSWMKIQLFNPSDTADQSSEMDFQNLASFNEGSGSVRMLIAGNAPGL